MFVAARSKFILVAVLAYLFFMAPVGDCCAKTNPVRPKSISIVVPPALLSDSVARTAADDSLALLRQAFPSAKVSLNNSKAAIQMIIREPVSSRAAAIRKPYPVIAYPDQVYRWRSAREGGRIVLRADVSSAHGASSALYGLLQEKLGFRFYHPRRTLIPTHRHWPLPERFSWKAIPRFHKRGFHLHTLHPTELVEQLHNPLYPGALADVREYIDWLARNGQNVMQFYLLRDVDRNSWVPHARAVVDYAHRRGIMVGVEFSLCMLQQKAFQVFKPLRPIYYRHQVDRSLAWLFQVPWDFVSVEFTLGEYLPDLGGILTGLKGYLEEEITGRYRTPAMAVTHVIRSNEERAGTVPAGLPDEDDFCSGPERKSGILIHTVMCYSAVEANAPVYGNINQRFMMERAINETQKRETWYWPESAYWVGFDNSVPLMLLPYLDARWSDMEAMEKIGVSGHLTFTSGWEWGYWLTDWSIARWSWRYREGGRTVQSGPLSILYDLFPDARLQGLWNEALELQKNYLKERELLRYMAALAPFSELPPPFDQPFQPEPAFTNDWLLWEASDSQADGILQGPVAKLEEYAVRMTRLVEQLERLTEQRLAGKRAESEDMRGIFLELTRGLRITALRAQHRALTLRALVAQRETRNWWLPVNNTAGRYLTEAATVRQKALLLVKAQERIYRYPLGLIARKREDFTAYGFGYLYPVSDLLFWKREEEQVRQLRFDAFFMCLWNFRRTVGLESLLF